MKFSILNLTSFLIIVALIVTLAMSRWQNRSVVVNSSDHMDTWNLLDYRVQSTWDDARDPLPLSPSSVLELARRLNQGLNEQSEQTRLEQWRTQSINLSRLHSDTQWVYVVFLQGFEPGHLGFERMETVRFLVLMDGSVVFDSKPYSADIVNAVEQIEFANIVYDGQYISKNGR